MKTIFTLAAVAAAIATASVASAHETTAGHWEWQTLPSFGPKSTGPSRVRIWVKGAEISMANCDCAMMKADHASCMMDMHGKNAKPSAG